MFVLTEFVLTRFYCTYILLFVSLFNCLFTSLFTCLLADLPGMFDVKIVNADLEMAYKQLTQSIFGVSSMNPCLYL